MTVVFFGGFFPTNCRGRFLFLNYFICQHVSSFRSTGAVSAALLWWRVWLESLRACPRATVGPGKKMLIKFPRRTTWITGGSLINGRKRNQFFGVLRSLMIRRSSCGWIFRVSRIFSSPSQSLPYWINTSASHYFNYDRKQRTLSFHLLSFSATAAAAGDVCIDQSCPWFSFPSCCVAKHLFFYQSMSKAEAWVY